MIIKKATSQSYIDLPVKVTLNLITFFQVLKICSMSLVLLNLTFQLSLVTLMQYQNLSGKMIINKSEGTKTDALTSYHGLHQFIPQPTHILANSSSCIDLIFTDQPNLAIHWGTHPSLHPNCHHQIIYCKLNLKIAYPPPYQRLVWDFKRANTDSVRKAIKIVDWHFMFLNKTVHEQVSVFNNELFNILFNYMPHKYITNDGKDPPWMTKCIKDKF